MNAVELELNRHFFSSVAEEMGAILQRSSFSPNIKERRDFSCAVFNVSGEMVAQAAHIPVHLGSAPMSVKAVLEALPMHEGEHYILNDPYAGGTHLPDITLVSPIFLNGELAFLVANRAHHADVGGINPGSMGLSKHIDDEGFRFGPTRLTDEFAHKIASNSRTPWEREGDLKAQIAANQRGVLRLKEMAERGDIVQAAEELLDYSERFASAVIAEFPQGEWVGRDVLDSDGYDTFDIPIRAKVTIRGSEFVADFTGSSAQVEGPVNVPLAVTVSSVLYALRCLLPEDLPANDGLARCIRVVTEPESVLNATFPAPVALGNVETSQRIVDVLFRALSEAMPDRIPAASCGSMNSVIVAGNDARTGREFAYYETIGGGGGAGPGYEGADGRHTHMTNTLNTPVEALEHAYPFRVESYELVQSPHKAGENRGGAGVRRMYSFDCPAEVLLMTERRRSAPWGLHGASDGQRGMNTLIRQGIHELPDKVSLEVVAGDRVVVQTPCGGSFPQNVKAQPT